MRHGKTTQRAERVKNLVALILTLGLGSSLVILTTAPAAGSPGLRPELTESKRYLRDMEIYGGKANILASQFRAWLESLFQGRTLAYTLAFLTLLLAGSVWWFASPLPPEPPPEA